MRGDDTHTGNHAAAAAAASESSVGSDKAATKHKSAASLLVAQLPPHVAKKELAPSDQSDTQSAGMLSSGSRCLGMGEPHAKPGTTARLGARHG